MSILRLLRAAIRASRHHLLRLGLAYGQLNAEVEALAGYLQQVCGVKRGDRVLLDMQNCPQFVIAYYAILRADAMVVPVNPMLLTEELSHYVQDSGATVAFASQEIFPRVAPLLGKAGLQHAIVATYSDYLTAATELTVPILCAPRVTYPQFLARQRGRMPSMRPMCQARTWQPPTDLACMPYTSGTTGKPKGCIHTHRT